MSVLDLIPAPLRAWAIALALLSIAVVAAGSAWKVQDWRYGKTLAEQARYAASQAQQRAEAATLALSQEQAKRVALEARLVASDQTHSRELTNAHKNQQRLSDRLATADVRLSVLLAATDAAAGRNDLPAPAGAVGVVHGGTRAELDPAHARRIVSITGDGDRGLIALKACQGYARGVWEASQRPAAP
jgi:hypothetical protein